jgi:nucleotide-binding universal stress UspA family protein
MKTLAIASQLTLKNILYATDLSFAAERALPYALEMARRYGSTVYAVHAIHPDYDPLVPPSAWPNLEQDEEIFRQGAGKNSSASYKVFPTKSSSNREKPGRSFHASSMKDGLICWFSARTVALV